MSFFSLFPKVFYDLAGTKPVNPIIATNITARTKILEILKNNVSIFYEYDIKDGETPEIIAHKYYGDPERHWIVLYANNIVDPFYDWPLSETVFGSFIEGKYGTILVAQTTIHHYNKIVTKTDSVTGLATVSKYQIDADAYAVLPTSSTSVLNLSNSTTVTTVTTKEIIYSYDYEADLNNSKRTIKLIDKIYISQIEKEFKALLNG